MRAYMYRYTYKSWQAGLKASWQPLRGTKTASPYCLCAFRSWHCSLPVIPPAKPCTRSLSSPTLLRHPPLSLSFPPLQPCLIERTHAHTTPPLPSSYLSPFVPPSLASSLTHSLSLMAGRWGEEVADALRWQRRGPRTAGLCVCEDNRMCSLTIACVPLL